MTEMTKRQRARLARAELWLQLACTAERWAREIEGTEAGIIPFAEWPSDDAFVALGRTYGLSARDLTRACRSIAAQAETRAVAGGYADALADPTTETT